MINRIGQYTIEFENQPEICGYASIVGKKESEGPIKEWFDKIVYDSHSGKDTWEQAESDLQKQALDMALGKAKIKSNDCNMVFSGDLLNQCISSGFGLRDFGIPFLGQYGACSTMAQSLIMASVMIESGAARYAGAMTSSHFCSAERQYRFPLEYGGQRTPTAQWTVTGSGSIILGEKSPNPDTRCKVIKRAVIGKITDLGVTDANNMGAAMAPAACETIKSFFLDTGASPDDYDAIFTGDLGAVGTKLLHELLEKENIDIRNKHKDCGLMIFDNKQQDTHAGGSGCGCSASVLCSYILKNMDSGNYNKILFIATGALMSPTSCQQGESIPSIAHLVEIEGI